MEAVARQTEVQLTDASELGVRVVVSPLLTLAMGLMDALGDRPATPWRRLLKQRIRGIDSAPLAMFAPNSQNLPNALLPLPSSSATTFEAELAALRTQPLEVLLSEIAVIHPHGDAGELLPFTTDPAGALTRYCDALAEHWDRMLRPSWPRMRRLLEREVLLLGHKMAVEGVAGMLASLHPGLTYANRRLCYCIGDAVATVSYVANPALTLAPVACEPEMILVNPDHPEATVIAYAARGSAELWEEARCVPTDELAVLLGATRASIALALATPATTTTLAEWLNLAPSSVSRHLSSLLATGLVDRTRRGPAVYYRLTERGTTMLDLF